MIDKAIGKITDEMMKIGTPLSRFVEEHLTEICKNEEVAEKLLAEDKSLKEICKKIEDAARKVMVGNQAQIPDAEVLQMARDYYEITDEDLNAKRVHSERVDILDLF